MSLKQRIQQSVAPLYNKVWYGPKGRLAARIKKVCDDLPQNRRLTVVTVLMSAFVLTAFFVFGNACYRMGARHAFRHDSGFIELSTEHNPSAFIQGYRPSCNDTADITGIMTDSVAYETLR